MSHFIAVPWLWGVLQGPQGSPKGPKGPDDEKLRAIRSRDWILYYEIIFIRENWVLHQRLTKEYWIIWDIFWPLSSFKIPPKGFWGSPIIPNGQPSVPREFKIKHFTLGWFHFGKTRCNLHGKWTKDYLMTWGMFWPFSGSEGSLRVSNGSQLMM